MKRLLPAGLAALLLVLAALLPGRRASVNGEIDAGLLRQSMLNNSAFIRQHYWTSHYVALCRHEQMLALFGQVYGYGACVLVYKDGKHASLSASGNHFRATISGGHVTVLESPREGWPAEDVRRLFPWYVCGLIFGSQYAGVEGRVFNRAKADAAVQLGLPLKSP